MAPTRRTHVPPLVAALTAVTLVAALAASAPPASAEAAYGAYQRPGVNVIASLADDGAQADAGAYFASVSDDGRLVAFGSGASNLVEDPISEYGNVYLRDLVAGTTTLVSRGLGGEAPNQGSMQPGLSGDGSTVVFVSYATNLVPGDPSDGRGAQVYAYDVATGTIELISASLDGTATNGGALQPQVSGDGRLVAWHSSASNLVEGDTNARIDVFLHDRVTGETRLVSRAADGTLGNGTSALPGISGDGSTVIFSSSATNLVADDGNGAYDIFAVDTATGEVELVSVGTDGAQGNYDSTFADVNADGTVIAFQSGASNLVPTDTNGMTRAIDGFDVFVRDRTTATTERVSVAATGSELRESLSPSLSDDGRFVAFSSIKPGEDSSSFTSQADAYVHDRLTSATERLSATPKGNPGTGDTDNPVLSGDGTVVVFQTDAPDLVPGDGNEVTDVVWRRRGGDLEIMSLTTGGFRGRDVVGSYAMAGTVLAAGADGSDPGAAAGADLRSADIVHRPEDADMLVRIRVAELASTTPPQGVPGVYSTAGIGRVAVPGLAYGLVFALDGVRYELRASHVGGVVTPLADEANVVNPAAAFGLYRCTTTCARVATPEGGLGTTGEEVRIDLPLSPLGLEEGESITGLTAVVAAGDGTQPFLEPIDEIPLGDVTVPQQSITVGVGDQVSESGSQSGHFAVRFDAPVARGTALQAQVCYAGRCAERAAAAP